MNLYAEATRISSEVIQSIWKKVDSYDCQVNRTIRTAEILIGITIRGIRYEFMGVLTQEDDPEALIQVMRNEIEKIINEIK